MLVEIALEMSFEVFPSVWNKIYENSENLEIVPSAKLIIEGIYKTYFEQKCII